MQLMQAQSFLNFLASAFAPEPNELIQFWFMATVSDSMATRSSDLDDQKSGLNIQTEGHSLTPPTDWNGPQRDRGIW